MELQAISYFLPFQADRLYQELQMICTDQIFIGLHQRRLVNNGDSLMIILKPSKPT